MNQKTIKKKISIDGIGLHTGNKCSVTLSPLEENSGIYFKTKDSDVVVKVNYNDVIDSSLCTTLLLNDGKKIHTVEHLLSALFGIGIDNCLIEVDGGEIPILDGSSYNFILEIIMVGIKKYEANRKYLKILKEVKIQEDDKYVVFYPNTNNFILEVTIDFPSTAIKRKNKAIVIDDNNYMNVISLSKTFGFEKDIDYLRDKGLIKGGSLSNAIVIGKDDTVINPYTNISEEDFVKHKILDAVGDLSLCGYSGIKGFYCGYKPSHKLNNLLLKEIFSDDTNYEIIT